MKAARKTADGRFEIAEVDDPVLPADDWVKGRVRMAGICGTHPRHWQKAEAGLHCRIMGQEMAGEVVEAGADVTRVAVGDRRRDRNYMTASSDRFRLRKMKGLAQLTTPG